ncbi:MAG: hypothetical protein LC107_03735 [Chitinophagales bacterium]|nr:hypothetical protein [Chitinophagales bacterium]
MKLHRNEQDISLMNIESKTSSQVSSISDIDIKSFILMWAFAETSIGGVLHALKLPFTGILVGGIAVISIALIGYYQKEGSGKILEALLIVLMVKLLVSPHSPWQAYIAVGFQGYIGSLIYRKKSNFKLKTMVFAVLALFESAIQKLLVALLIFGNNFFESLDLATASVAGSMGWTTDISLVYTVFGIYLSLHLVVGVWLGLWIPRLPTEVERFMHKMPALDYGFALDKGKAATFKKRLWVSVAVFVLILLILKIVLPETNYTMLIWMFLRALLVSLALVFIVGPLIKKGVEKYIQRKNIDDVMWKDIIDLIPNYSLKAYSMLRYVNHHFSGFNRVKYLVIGFIALSVKEIHK